MASATMKGTIKNKNNGQDHSKSRKRSLEAFIETRWAGVIDSKRIKKDPDLVYDKSLSPSRTSSIEIIEIMEDDNETRTDSEASSVEGNVAADKEEQIKIRLRNKSTLASNNKNQSVNNDRGNETNDIYNEIPSCSNQPDEIDQLLELESAESMVRLFEEYSNENGYQDKICHLRDSNDKIWFAAKDLGRILEYSENSNPIKHHVKNKNKIELSRLTVDGDKPNFPPNSMFIDVHGARDLISNSPKKEPKKFYRWLLLKRTQEHKLSSSSRQSQLVHINNNKNCSEINLFENNNIVNLLLQKITESNRTMSESYKTSVMNIEKMCKSNETLALNNQILCKNIEKLTEQNQELMRLFLATNQNNQQNNENPQKSRRRSVQNHQQQQGINDDPLRQAIIILKNEHTCDYKFIQRQLKTLPCGVKKFTDENPDYEVIFKQDYVTNNEKVFDTVKNHLSQHRVKFFMDNRHTRMRTTKNLIKFLNDNKIVL